MLSSKAYRWDSLYWCRFGGSESQSADRKLWLHWAIKRSMHSRILSDLTHSGNFPSTRQTYSFKSSLFLICSWSFWAVAGLRAISRTPDVNRSNLWITRSTMNPHKHCLEWHTMQVCQLMLFRQHRNHCIVSVFTGRMNLRIRKQVNYKVELMITTVLKQLLNSKIENLTQNFSKGTNKSFHS